MALPLLGSKARKRDQIIAIDLGAHTTKAVQVQRKGERFVLTGCVVQEVPARDGAAALDQLSAHLAKIVQAMGARGKPAAFALGATDAFVRPAELPLVPASEMRALLKFNAKNYLQQDLPDHVFDCHILPPPPSAKPEPVRPGQRGKVLVAGAKKRVLDDLQAAAKAAGLMPEAVVPGLIGPANAFESAQPDVFAKGPVALVDLGFRNSSISLLLAGEPILHRVVGIGGERLTSGVAEALGVSYAEAEGIKLGLADEVQSTMVALLAPLGRELRASIDFFEHQQDRTVAQVYVSGGSARSDHILEMLQTELMVPCVRWNPVQSLTLSLPANQGGELEACGPQLAVAVGTALAVI
jgi:type IV pilus assembly protein PilM